MNCETCKVELPEYSSDHKFAGYGFFVGYCPIHCPREMDGTICEGDHPELEHVQGKIGGDQE